MARPAGVPTKCRVCSGLGHDFRTCPRAVYTGKRKCNECQQPGHDVRTCPRLAREAQRMRLEDYHDDLPPCPVRGCGLRGEHICNVRAEYYAAMKTGG